MKKKSGHWKTSRFQGKVLLGILFPVVASCLIANIVISTLLGYQLMKKKETIENGYLSVIYSQMEDTKKALDVLGLASENSFSVKWAMSGNGFDTMEKKRYALNTQKTLSASLEASNVRNYVDGMILINRNGGRISVTPLGEEVDVEAIFASPILKKDGGEGKAKAGLVESVIDKGEIKLAYMYPLDREDHSYLYMELNPRLFVEFLKPYEKQVGVVIADRTEKAWSWCSSVESGETYKSSEGGEGSLSGSLTFEPFGIVMGVMPGNEWYSQDMNQIVSAFLVTLILVLCIGVTVSRLISTQITKPLGQLAEYISRMSDEEELTTDKSIEKGEDEIADIGKAFNMLVRHINALMKEQKKMYEQKQRLEMNALQAQINPHFLYNTLDSVRWMAVFQKADSIASTVMSLENLLRNMAKGVGDKITLREELSLAEDYVNLQQVRYMEIFDYVCDVPEEYMECKIVKMSLQPIIENAILHGIEPTGTYGEIKLTVCESEGDLYIAIEDNGIGIDQKDFEKVVAAKNKNAMSGIGIINVDERLRMTYGEGYGLIFEGEKGRFARVTVHIPKEAGERYV